MISNRLNRLVVHACPCPWNTLTNA
jgi:hypothetical protein